MTIWELISDLSESILYHYREKLRGLIFLEGNPNLMLIILEEVDTISFLARGQIFNYFYKSLRKTEKGKKWVLEKRSDPSIRGIIISPKELEFNLPIVVIISSLGHVLYDPDNIFIQSNKKIVNYMGKKLIDLKNVKRGEVVDI
ncbi:MAG: hypothetical protein QXR86_02695 [Metallosphaera sp.]